MYGLSQWETTLHCNVVSLWLSPYPEWSSSLRTHTSADILSIEYPKFIETKIEIWINPVDKTRWKYRLMLVTDYTPHSSICVLVTMPAPVLKHCFCAVLLITGPLSQWTKTSNPFFLVMRLLCATLNRCRLRPLPFPNCLFLVPVECTAN